MARQLLCQRLNSGLACAAHMLQHSWLFITHLIFFVFWVTPSNYSWLYSQAWLLVWLRGLYGMPKIKLSWLCASKCPTHCSIYPDLHFTFQMNNISGHTQLCSKFTSSQVLGDYAWWYFVTPYVEFRIEFRSASSKNDLPRGWRDSMRASPSTISNPSIVLFNTRILIQSTEVLHTFQQISMLVCLCFVGLGI